MFLGTEQCKQALLKYRKEVECSDLDNLVIDILLNPIESEYLNLIDHFLSKHDEKEHNEILNKINEKANQIYEELGIRKTPDDCITNNDRINTYRCTLINYINFCTDKLLKEEQEKINLEEYISAIENIIIEFNKGYSYNINNYNIKKEI